MGHAIFYSQQSWIIDLFFDELAAGIGTTNANKWSGSAKVHKANVHAYDNIIKICTHYTGF